MPGPTPVTVTITDAQRAVLTTLTRTYSTPQRLALRARLILALSLPYQVKAVCQNLAITDKTLQHWRSVWVAATAGLAVAEADADPKRRTAVMRTTLTDDARPGTPPQFSAEQVAHIVAIACESPPAGTSHWTHAEIALAAMHRGLVPTISARSVGRFLKRSGSQTA